MTDDRDLQSTNIHLFFAPTAGADHEQPRFHIIFSLVQGWHISATSLLNTTRPTRPPRRSCLAQYQEWNTYIRCYVSDVRMQICKQTRGRSAHAAGPSFLTPSASCSNDTAPRQQNPPCSVVPKVELDLLVQRSRCRTSLISATSLSYLSCPHLPYPSTCMQSASYYFSFPLLTTPHPGPACC